MARIRRALRKLLFPNDFAGKALFRTAPGAIDLVKAPGVFVRELPSELDEDTVPHYSDILIEFILDTTIRRWAKVAQRAKIALMHIEFTDRLRPGLAVRMLEYALAIKKRYGLHTLARQCIVVVGVVAKEGRLRALDCGLDGEGRAVWIPIFYADEFDFRRLSPREQGLLLIRMFTIMHLTKKDVKAIRQLVRELFEVESEAEYVLNRTVLLALAQTRKLDFIVRKALVEEAKMPMTRTASKRMNSLLAELMQAPVNRSFVQRTIARPAREEGRHETHVGILLQALRRNDIWLSEEQKAQLQSLPCEKLPDINVALDAKDANDFARKAGLNGSGPKK